MKPIIESWAAYQARKAGTPEHTKQPKRNEARDAYGLHHRMHSDEQLANAARLSRGLHLS